MFRGVFVAALVAMAVVALAPAASAQNRFTLDPQATSPGRIVEDAAGNAYVTWTHRSSGSLPDAPMFCKIPPGGTCASPIELPIPAAMDNTDAVAGVFPVLGDGNTVFVAAPRYVQGDVVTWASFNGGQSFAPGVGHPEAYAGTTDPSSVIRLAGGYLFIASSSPGLGFGFSGAVGEGAGSNFEFTTAATGAGVGGSSMAFEGLLNPVLVYWRLSNPFTMSFYRYTGSGPPTAESSWEGPIAIGNGYEAKVASDSGRLFMVSRDYAGGSNPSRVDVRRYLGTGFGAPVTVADDATAEPFAGGAIAVSPAGEVAVAWPGVRSGDGARVMRLFTSVDGGASFNGETDVAGIGGGYRAGDNAQLALGAGEAGWLTYRDEGGLQLADLNPIAESARPVVKPPAYKGKKKTVVKRVGAFGIAMTLPGACVQSLQSFAVAVGKKKRHGRGRGPVGKLRLRRVGFLFDGGKVATASRKPFSLLVDPGPLAAGSSHAVTAKVSATFSSRPGGEKKVSRTLKGRIEGC